MHTVLKYSTPASQNVAAIRGVVITAAIGCPLPIGLPIVTISGTTSIKERNQNQNSSSKSIALV
jgi:hypothetical protein